MAHLLSPLFVMGVGGTPIPLAIMDSIGSHCWCTSVNRTMSVLPASAPKCFERCNWRAGRPRYIYGRVPSHYLLHVLLVMSGVLTQCFGGERDAVQLYLEGDAQHRLLAIHSIEKSELPGQDKFLFRVAIGDAFQSIRFAAADVLAKLETVDTATARFIEATSDEKSLQAVGRMRALAVVAHLGGKGAAECLRAWLQSPNTEMAVAAADGLGTLGDPAQVSTLIEALSTHDIELKPAVADALERLTGKDYRFNLVKWSEWQRENPSKNNSDTRSRNSDPGYDDSYDESVWKSPIDVMIVFDTTKSMLHIWPEFSGAIDAVLYELVKRTPSLRIGSVKYRASDPERTSNYMIKPKALTRQCAEMRKDIKAAAFGGGSGGLHLGLIYAVNGMAWRPHARRVVILIGDYTPEGDGQRACMQLIREGWQMDHIMVNVLYVQTLHGVEHRETYKRLAQSGVGHFYEYNKAECHLVDMDAEKVDVKKSEHAKDTAAKWCTPRTVK